MVVKVGFWLVGCSFFGFRDTPMPRFFERVTKNYIGHKLFIVTLINSVKERQSTTDGKQYRTDKQKLVTFFYLRVFIKFSSKSKSNPIQNKNESKFKIQNLKLKKKTKLISINWNPILNSNTLLVSDSFEKLFPIPIVILVFFKIPTIERWN